MTRDYEGQRPLYRSRHGVILGVCRGSAETRGLSVGWVRFLAVMILLFTGFWPMIGLYFLAAVLMKPEPVVPLSDDEEREFYSSYTASRSMALARLKHAYDSLDRRVQRMENVVTSREYDWERRLNS